VSLEDLDSAVWASLSPRKHLAGRPLVSRLVRRVVRKWPAVAISQARPDSYGVMLEQVSASIERSERQNVRMGIILSLVLGVLIQEIVKAVLAWWMKSASHRISLVGWQTEMRR
jgi:tetrahydromethanopterin S-methyltransferase subunit E